jgi:hypothetical protein
VTEETRWCRHITCAHMRRVACYNRGYGGQVSFVSGVRIDRNTVLLKLCVLVALESEGKGRP